MFKAITSFNREKSSDTTQLRDRRTYADLHGDYAKVVVPVNIR